MSENPPADKVARLCTRLLLNTMIFKQDILEEVAAGHRHGMVAIVQWTEDDTHSAGVRRWSIVLACDVHD
jgi:hypothetical protein